MENGISHQYSPLNSNELPILPKGQNYVSTWARKIAARDNNDALHSLAIDLQDAVDAEKDSEAIAEKVIAMLQ